MAKLGLGGGWCCREGSEFKLSFAGNKDDSDHLGCNGPGRGPLGSVIVLRQGSQRQILTGGNRLSRSHGILDQGADKGTEFPG